MSNFGFSFMDASHKEDPPAGKKRPLAWLGGGQDNEPLGSSSSNQDSLYTVGAWAQEPAPSFRQQRTAIEKQADVIGFLKERPDRKPATAKDILAGTGIDLEIADVEVSAAHLHPDSSYLSMHTLLAMLALRQSAAATSPQSE
jgi:hypothetical protein